MVMISLLSNQLQTPAILPPQKPQRPFLTCISTVKKPARRMTAFPQEGQ
jgi:hypothetical protein